MYFAILPKSPSRLASALVAWRESATSGDLIHLAKMLTQPESNIVFFLYMYQYNWHLLKQQKKADALPIINNRSEIYIQILNVVPIWSTNKYVYFHIIAHY